MRLIVKRVGVLVLFVGLLCAAPRAWARPFGRFMKGDGDKRGRMEKRWSKMADELGLTEEQQKQLKEHREENRSAAEQLREQKGELRDALRQELQKIDLNKEKIQQLHNELKAVLAEMEDRRLEGILTVREILTPEQAQKLHEVMEEKREHFREKRSRHKRWGPGRGEEPPEE